MQHLEVSCAVRRFFKSLGFKGLSTARRFLESCVQKWTIEIKTNESNT